MTGWVIPEGCEADSRTCRGCLKKGHIYPNCPDNPSNGGAGRVLVAVQGEETEDEEEGTEDRIFMINSDSNERVLLFAENEILLDNQASQAIFKNKNLLHNITSRVRIRWVVSTQIMKGLLSPEPEASQHLAESMERLVWLLTRQPTFLPG